jgi:SAM-dependent methyltransferase
VKTAVDLRALYAHRFSVKDLPAKNAIWKALCDGFFGRYVKPTDTVIDIGAGYCEFINNIAGGRKIAVDLNPDVKQFAAPNVEVLNASCMAVSSLPEGAADVVFMSNFLEHLQNKEQVFDTLRECRRLLRPGGRLMILQPNIRFLADVYWDFFDHHVPLSDRSLVEALEALDMRVTVCLPRFLPYTTKSWLPKGPLLVRLYLTFPPVWRLLGRQAFVVAERV